MQVATEQGRCVDVRWHRRKDGSRVYMTGVLKGLRDEEGTLLGYSKVFLDDTARRRGPTMICSSLPMWPATTCRSPCGRCPALPTFSGGATTRNSTRRLRTSWHSNPCLEAHGCPDLRLLAFSQLDHPEGRGALWVYLDDAPRSPEAKQTSVFRTGVQGWQGYQASWGQYQHLFDGLPDSGEERV